MRAYVGIEAKSDLIETATQLARALGVALIATDRFDEYPAFAGEISGLAFALLGLPPKELDVREDPTNSFELQVASVGSARNLGAEIDISDHLAKYLTIALDVRCWPLSE